MYEPDPYLPTTCAQCGGTTRQVNGAWLRWRREHAAVTLGTLAQRIHLSKAHLSDLERGNRHVTPRVRALYLAAIEPTPAGEPAHE